MPGCITHYMFAKDCLDKLNNNELKNTLDENINIFFLGSCGPNFFEYHNNVPSIFSKNLANISNLIHNKNIDLFFEDMINYSINNPYIKFIFNKNNFTDICISYFCGFLSHYLLDRSLHPYIFYLQDKLKDQYKLKSYTSLHKSIETNIDSIFLYKLKKLTPKEYIKIIDINISNDEKLILCDMYNFLIKSSFNKDVSYNDIKSSLNTFKYTQTKLIFSNGFHSKIFLFTKNLLCKTGYIESKTYSKYNNCVNDLLNEKNSIWTDPFSNKSSNESVINIYNDALLLYQEIINIFSKYIHNKNKMMDILNKIDNKSYITNQNFIKPNMIHI